MRLEWAQVEARKVVVASNDRAWVHELPFLPDSDPFAYPMEGSGTFQTTRQLLDGVIGAAQQVALRGVSQPRLTPIRYAWKLVGFYQIAHHVPPMLFEVAKQFETGSRLELARLIRHIAREEFGHDELTLKDLEALGYDAESLVEAHCPPKAAALMEYVSRCTKSPEPVEIFGYCYASERPALEISRDYIAVLDRTLPAKATRSLRTHSSAGVEVTHVRNLVKSISRFDAPDRTRVARGTYETTLISAAPPSGGNPSEEDLERKLAKFRLSLIQKEV